MTNELALSVFVTVFVTATAMRVLLWLVPALLRRASHRDLPPVSRTWLAAEDRRAWGRGIDQSRVQSWPIQTNKGA